MCVTIINTLHSFLKAKMISRNSLPRVYHILSPSIIILALCAADGSVADSSYMSCNPNATLSVCRALNRTNPPGGNPNGGKNATRDICLPNGLCLNEFTTAPSEVYYNYWRNGCTQPISDGTYCPKVCILQSEVVS